MIDCALISSDETFRRLVRGLAQQPDTFGRLSVDIPESAAEVSREALGRILGTDVRVVFVDLGDSLTGVRVIEALSQEMPGAALVAAGPEIPAESLLRVMRAGASEYLPRPFTSDDVAAAVVRVRRRIAPAGTEITAKGLVSTFFSAKGGTGVTTLATNVAVVLAESTGQDTLLIDLVPSLGTAALQLGLQPRYSFLDVVQNFHRIDHELLWSFLEVHDSGVSVLGSPPLGPEEAVFLNADQVLGLIRLCRRHFAHIVVDAGNVVGGSAFAALGESDARVVVTTPDLPTLRNVHRVLELVQRHNGKGPPDVVLNHYDPDGTLTTSDVEKALKRGVTQTVREDPATVREAINLGRPAVSNRRSPFARDVRALAARFAGSEQGAARPEGLLDVLLRPLRNRLSQTRETS